jgi:hypothetical protein
VPKVGGYDPCPKPIPGLDYDNCYNARATTAANLRRGQAGAGELTMDPAVAAKAQAWADKLLERAAIASSTKNDGRDPKKCSENVYEETDPSKRA